MIVPPIGLIQGPPRRLCPWTMGHGGTTPETFSVKTLDKETDLLTCRLIKGTPKVDHSTYQLLSL